MLQTVTMCRQTRLADRRSDTSKDITKTRGVGGRQVRREYVERARRDGEDGREIAPRDGGCRRGPRDFGRGVREAARRSNDGVIFSRRPNSPTKSLGKETNNNSLLSPCSTSPRGAPPRARPAPSSSSAFARGTPFICVGSFVLCSPAR